MMENNLLNAKKKKFGLYEAALALILYIVFTNVFSFFWGMVPKDVRKAPYAAYFIAQFLIEALFAVVAYVVATTRKVDFVKGIGADKKINGNLVLYGILISFICLVFFGKLTDVFMYFLALLGYVSDSPSIEITNFGIYLVYVLVLCVAPAIGEEFLFRGAVASGLKERGMKVALLGSALIFSFMHGTPDQTIHQFIIGLVIGFIFLKTSNIWIGVVIHFINNFTSVTLMYVLSFFDSGSSTTEAVSMLPKGYDWLNLFGDLIYAIVMAVLGYAIIMRVFRKVFAEHQVLNNENVIQESEIIKVDGVEVETTIAIDGEVQSEEGLQENVANARVKKEKEMVPFSITIMFAIAGAYFAFMWGVSLLVGFGVV